MLCQTCGRQVEERAYCPYCGAHIVRKTASARSREKRPHVFALNPAEHLYHLSFVSTFFPHLSRQRTHQFRWLLFLGVLVVLVVSAGRFVPLSILLAALLMPVFYLLYFFDAQLYGNEPLRILGATFALGAVLGGALGVALYRYLLSHYQAGIAPAASYLLLTDLALPLLSLGLMLVGPLILYFTRPRFDELLDGLAFGAASGLGFAAAQSLVAAWLLIIGPSQSPGLLSSWLVHTLRIALLAPLVNAATTGLICAAIWLRRDRAPQAKKLGVLLTWPVALCLGMLGQVAPPLLSALIPGQILQLLWYALILSGLTLILRHVLHSGLIEKARALGHGQRLVCPECHHEVADMPFCPYCGLALLSISRRMRRPLVRAEEPI
jgi:RNA polymerase subunit RPABC4/transcription elongation factor Spt4